MNSDQVQSLIRTVLKFGAGTTVGVLIWHFFGLDPSSQPALDVMGAIAVLGAGLWSHFVHA